jgi:hypothetical protein
VTNEGDSATNGIVVLVAHFVEVIEVARNFLPSCETEVLRQEHKATASDESRKSHLDFPAEKILIYQKEWH